MCIRDRNLAHRVEKDYGPVRLLGYNLDKRGAEGQTDVPLFPGDTLRIILFWQARQTLSHDLALTFSVLSGRSPLTRFTFTPTDGLYPAPQWSANEIVRDAHDIGLPADLTPGRYRLQLVVADPAGRPLGPPLEIPFRLQSRP